MTRMEAIAAQIGAEINIFILASAYQWGGGGSVEILSKFPHQN